MILYRNIHCFKKKYLSTPTCYQGTSQRPGAVCQEIDDPKVCRRRPELHKQIMIDKRMIRLQACFSSYRVWKIL